VASVNAPFKLKETFACPAMEYIALVGTICKLLSQKPSHARDISVMGFIVSLTYTIDEE